MAKFKVGDIVVYRNLETYEVLDVGEKTYFMRDKDKNESALPILWMDDNCKKGPTILKAEAWVNVYHHKGTNKLSFSTQTFGTKGMALSSSEFRDEAQARQWPLIDTIKIEHTYELKD